MLWNEEVVELLGPFKQVGLVRDLAALQLLPGNSSFTWGLQALTTFCSSSELPGSSTEAPEGRWRELFRSAGVAELVDSDDAQDNLFCEEMRFIGGSYKVLPGIVDDSSFTLRNLCDGLFLKNPTVWAKSFQKEVSDLVIAALRLSHLVCTRAGLQRGARPEISDAVIIPSTEEFERLRGAVSLGPEEIQDVLSGLSTDALDSLTIGLGQVNFDESDPHRSSLFSTPLVRAEGELILALPGQLLASIRHAVIEAAKSHDVVADVAERYESSVSQVVSDSLELFSLTELDIALPDLSPFAVSTYLLDRDKCLCTYLATDDLSGYPSEDVFGTWDASRWESVFDDRVRAVEEAIFLDGPGPNEILHILVLQTLGRQCFIGFGGPLEPTGQVRHLVPASDLEIIARIEHGDPLALYKFARSADRVREHATIVATSVLDEFNLYRENAYSYYVTDSARPTVIMCAPGNGLDLRFKAHDELDLHGVQHHSGKGITEVALVNGGTRVPIYFPWKHLDEEPAQLIEIRDLHFWVVGERFENRMSRIALAVVDMVAYWTWQLLAAFPPNDPAARRVVLEVVVEPGDAWFDEALAKDWSPAVGLDISDRDRPVLHIPSLLAQELHGETNKGERYVVHALCELLREVLPGVDFPATEASLDQVAPLGLKKKMLLFSSGASVQFFKEPDLPPPRLMHEADVSDVLDEAGERLASQCPTGDIDAEDRTKVLNRFVEEVFGDIQVTLRRVSPSSLLEGLIALNESLLRAEAQRTLTLPTRLQCFPIEDEIVQELVREGPKTVTTAVSSRFLIELVAASPPSGLRPFSLNLYDRLIALASEVVTRGMISDAVAYLQADYELSVLPSRRLGINREGNYEKGRVAFMPSYARSEIVHSESEFASHWEERAAKERPDALEWLDDGARAEFGVSLTDLIHFLFDVIAVGMDQQSVVKRLHRHELVERLRDKSGWAESLVSDTLDRFCLRPRDDFLSPPSPFSLSDVFPWKFNRDLSYIRRPFVLREANGVTEILWGNRNVEMAAKYLVLGLCYGGRLKARSPEMKEAMQKIREQESRSFEDAAARAFEVDPTLAVKKRVKKLTGKEIARSNGEQLGDIDVLVADPVHRIVLPVEVKDLALARTPIELSRELEEAFSNEPGSSAQKHLERTAWIRDHLAEVLTELGISDEATTRWAVQPMFVVDQLTMSPYVANCPMPIRQLGEVRALLLGNGCADVFHDLKWNG